MKLWRIPTIDHLSKYGHPNGWVIVHCERSWSERVGAVRGQQTAGPKRWWEVRMAYARNRRNAVRDFLTLREAREWCDENTPPRHLSRPAA